MKKKKRTYNPDRKQRFCDPGACDECQYLGEGDFWCDKHQVIVVDEWDLTEDYMKCKQGGRRKNEPSADR